jgi:hypothetical protein
LAFASGEGKKVKYGFVNTTAEGKKVKSFTSEHFRYITKKKNIPENDKQKVLFI